MLTQSTRFSRSKRQPFMAALLLMLAFAMFMTMGCGIANSLLGGKTSGTVDDLWADVPRLDGLTKSNLDLPLSTRLIIKTAVSAAMGKDGGDFNFIAFTTGKTTKEVMDFYTTQKMTEAGWNSPDLPGCTGDTSGASAVGSLCIFGKQVGKQGTALVIVVAQDESTKQTQLFYVRFEANNLTPTS